MGFSDRELLFLKLLMPVPGGFDDIIQVGELGLPAELFCGFCIRSDEHGRITRSAVGLNDLNIPGGNCFNFVNYRQHGIAFDLPEV